MARKIGFIGGGNMASAIYGGIIGNNLAAASDIYVYDIDTEKLKQTAAEVGFTPAASNLDIVQTCDIVFLAIKPHFTEGVMNEIRASVRKEQAFVSIVAGWTNEKLHQHLGENGRVLRVMPNTPLLVGQGMSALCSDNDLTDEEMAYVSSVFEGMGRIEVLEEKHIAIFSGIAGSSPAYTYMFIEAMADAACMHGLPRDIAYRVCAQAVLGSGKMVLETGQHPGALKDAVCSPGGATIEAVYALERGAFRGTIIEAIEDATVKFNRL